MALVLALVIFAAVFSFGALRFGARSGIWEPSGSIAGPSTLEELFAARYARGDIDNVQYRRAVDRLTMQLHS